MNGSGKIVFIVDDDEDIRDIVGLVLGATGYATVTAADGTEALALLRADLRPALILLDLRMPGLSGEELINEVQRMPSLRDVGIVVMSGDTAARDIAGAIGAAGYLSKPMDFDDLVATVGRLIHAQPS